VVTQDDPIDFKAKRAEFLAKKAQEAGEALPEPEKPAETEFTWDASVQLPDLNNGKSEDDYELDRIIDNIDFAVAYNKWIGKSNAVGGKRDGNMISCPMPDHPDRNPSAWFDDQGRWNCGSCETGGDVYDLAAIHFGYPMPGYKDGALFHKLRQDMAESFGWNFKKVPGGQIIYRDEQPNEPVPEVAQPAPLPSTPPVVSSGEAVQGPDGADSQPAQTPAEVTTPSNISQMWADDDEEEEVIIYPNINWRSIVPEDTFLFEYLSAASNDDSPEEYHFWHGLIGLGHAVGRNVYLEDHNHVFGNLMVCLMGGTGVGKSRSRRWLTTVLKDAAPYHEDGSQTTGVKLVPVPASGEYLVSAFSYEGRDPSNNKSSLGYQPVNGIVDFDELSAMVQRANRQGATLKPTIMSLSDCNDEVKIGSMTRGDIVAEKPFCSIIASTQPKAVRNLLTRSDTGSGFVNRWVFAGGREKQTEVIGGRHATFSVDLTRAIEELRKVRGWGGFEKSIHLSEEAYSAYSAYFRKILEPKKRGDDTDLLKRIDLLSKKLMLLFAINKRQTEVDVQCVHAMMEVMDYVIECFGILGSNIGSTIMQDVINELNRHIIRHMKNTQRGASARDLARYTHRKQITHEQIKKALDVMTSLDMIEIEKPKTTVGRPSIRYKVVGE
jgi:hypothetical protein